MKIEIVLVDDRDRDRDRDNYNCDKIRILFPKQQTTFEKLLLVVLIFYEEYFMENEFESPSIFSR